MRIEDAALTLHAALDANARLVPERSFIYSYDRSYTFEEIRRLSNGLSVFMASVGIGRGDMACLVLPRVPEMIISFLAMSRMGVIPAPVNYTLGRNDIEVFISSVSPKVIVIHEKFLKDIDTASIAERGVTVIVVGEVPKGLPGHVPWEEACVPSSVETQSDVGFNDIAYLNYTTGSSGSPKGAIATHYNVYWNTRASVEAMRITADDVHLCMFASFAHPHELFARALYTGGSIVLLEEINPKTVSRTINLRGVTCMMGLSPMYDMMSAHCANMKFDSLRVAESGGMYCRPDIIRGFKRNFGIPVLSVWGSTETSGIAIANTPDRFREDGSAGRVCPHYELRLLDEEGRDAPAGQPGELAFRGPGVVSGYLNSEDYSSMDGWYLSGDVATMDAEGYCYFMDRKSGMLKVAGLKVYPLQVEIVLMSHEGIKEAAVIGAEERLHGVRPKAFIIPVDGAELSPEEIKKFCKGRLAEYMIPRQIEFVTDLPRIGSGKVNKKALKEAEGQ